MNRTDGNDEHAWNMAWEHPATTNTEDTTTPEEPDGELWTPGDELDLTTMDLTTDVELDLTEDTDDTAS